MAALIEKLVFSYRICIFIYMFSWWIESIARFNRENKRWAIMFTHWTTTLQIIDLALKIIKHHKLQPKSIHISSFSKLTFSATLIVTVLFWILIVPAKRLKDPAHSVYMGEIHAHGANLLVCFIDLMVNYLVTNLENWDKDESKPKLYFKSLLHLELYLGSYFLFSLIYWLFDREKNVIYEPLNFNNIHKSFNILLSIFLVIAPIFTFILYFIEALVEKSVLKIEKYSHHD